jgi:hypothetical protein
MIISASHMVFDEASTCDSLQLTFSLVPKLVGRSMMDEYGEPKGPRELHLGQHSRSKGHARSDTQIELVHGSEWPPTGKRRADCVLGSRRMLRDVVSRPQQIGRLIASLSGWCLLQRDDVGSNRPQPRPRYLAATFPVRA